MISDPQILSATIIGFCTVCAAIIAAATGALIGRRFDNQQRLKESLRQAVLDIEFLLAVEKEHGKIHEESTGSSKIRTVRKNVKSSGLEWSQRFTPGRAKNLNLS